MDPEEKRLLNKVRKGDHSAFEQIFRKYYQSLFLYAHSILGDEENSKDILQSVFSKFWEQRKSLIINTSLKSYLIRTVRNLCIDYHKHQKVKTKYIDLARMEIMRKEAQYLDHIFEQKEKEVFEQLIDKMSDVIDDLPDKCREIFKLSRIKGMKNKDIAIKLNLSVRTVDTQIYRALKTLRDKLLIL